MAIKISVGGISAIADQSLTVVVDLPIKIPVNNTVERIKQELRTEFPVLETRCLFIYFKGECSCRFLIISFS